MVGVLADEELYLFTGGTPPSFEELESRFRHQVAGPSAVGEVWHNWIVRLGDPGGCVGFVQATLEANTAALAWLVGLEWQGRGIATEAVLAIKSWLAGQGVETFTAHIHPEHAASHGVASALGLRPTELVDDDGEVVWSG